MSVINYLFNNEIPLREVIKFSPSLLCNFFLTLRKKRSFFGPTFVTWVLTDQCQCECRHCFREPIPNSLSKFQISITAIQTRRCCIDIPFKKKFSEIQWFIYPQRKTPKYIFSI